MVGESRATWFSRIWSWNPTVVWDMAKEKVDAEIVATNSVDFEEGRTDFHREMDSFKRRNAVRSRTQKGRKRPNSDLANQGSNSSQDNYGDNNMKLANTTIFDHYHEWKVEPVDSAINSLPSMYQPIFKDAMHGHSVQLEHYLASLELNVNIRSAVNYTDDKLRTPLHFGAAFGHFEVVKLLLSYGANPNALDITKSITPLVCAAVSGNQKVMELLISEGADINHGLEKPSRGKIHDVKDCETESHTPISWAVRSGNIASVGYLLNKGALLTGTTINFETPLHLSAYLGNAAILKLLVQDEKNLKCLELRGGEDKNTALHIAVEQGHLNCIELLLSVGARTNKFNIHGRTPLHISGMTKDFQAMQLLLKHGADVNTRDTSNRTPLHHCIQLATSSNFVEAIECIEVLLRHGADINFRDANGLTPIHCAVESQISQVVATLLKQGADLTLANNAGQSGLDVLVKKMPHAIRYIRESLDFAIYVKRNDIADPECTISLDFRPIIVTNIGDKDAPRPRIETDVLLSFCAFGHKDILCHPLIEAFLILKWERVMKYFWASFIANLSMILTYSYFVFHLYATICPLIHENNSTTGIIMDLPIIEMPLYLELVWYCLFIMIFVFMTKELLQLFSSPKSYFKIVENHIQLVFITLALITILPDPFGPINLRGDLCNCLNRWEYTHYSTAAVSVVVAWFLILLRVGKLPKLGLYVQMLFKVVGNFGIITVTYSSIVIAFTLAFGILFIERNDVDDSPPTFSNIFHSFLTTMVMMTGELELTKVIKQTDPATNPLFVTTYIIFIAFLLLVTIVLMNLLVGLAVSDIQGLRAGAKVARLSRLVIAISQLESMLFSRHLDIFPKKLISRLRRNALLSYNDKMCTFSFRPHDPRDTTLPNGLQLEALQILEKRENNRIRDMKKANQETDSKFELLERIERLETLILQNLGVQKKN